MTEPSLPKKTLGLPNANLGLPASETAPEATVEEAPKAKKAFGGLLAKAGKSEKAEKTVAKPKVKAKKEKPVKGEAPAVADGVEKKSLLKMSPEELKAHFKNKKHGGLEPMVPIEEMVFIPKKPEVNLLPPDVLIGYQASDLKTKFLKIGGAVVFVFLAMFGLSVLSQAFSKGEITDLQDKAAALNVEIRQLQPYETYKTTIDGKREALYNQIQKNLDVGKVLDSVNVIGTNAGIKFTDVNLDASGEGECTSTDPFETAVATIGCLNFTAEGSGAESVTRFYDAAGKIPGFVNPYVPAEAAIAKEGKSTLEGTIGVTQEFYSTNTDKLNVPIDTQLAEMAPAAPATTTEEAPNGQ